MRLFWMVVAITREDLLDSLLTVLLILVGYTGYSNK